MRSAVPRNPASPTASGTGLRLGWSPVQQALDNSPGAVGNSGQPPASDRVDRRDALAIHNPAHGQRNVTDQISQVYW